jgi:microsomal dipeptidase-like Zn-dependent dipeptidase
VRGARAVVAAIAAAALIGGVAGAGDAASAPIRHAPELANRCVSLGGSAEPLYLKPTALGTYMIEDASGALLTVSAGTLTRESDPGPAAEWRIAGRRGLFVIASTSTDDALVLSGGALSLGAPVAMPISRAMGCRPYPEASTGAKGKPFSGTNPDGTVAGFADLHLHLIADLRAGGQVVSGEAFDRFGITKALGLDADVHGPDGSLDITGNLLRTGMPTGTHDTQGWPSFSGWPTFDTLTHQQAYYVWLERAWMAGERLVVAQTVEDEPICNLEPRTSHSCDETETVKLEIQRLRELADYVDAQSGGSGRGWLRIVTSPGQARRVIEHGKLAVVIGVESSDPLGCSESGGQPQCTKPEIRARLAELQRLGVRSMFITHWVDNALGGPAFEGGAKGEFIGLMEQSQTGHPFATEPCTTGDEDQGECNAKGLTDLGAYFVKRLIAEHMLIEADHTSQRTRAALFAIARKHDYPLVSSHTGTGGEWTPAQLRELHRLGGISSVTPGSATEMIDRIGELRRDSGAKGGVAVALGTDTGGFADLPGPPDDAPTNPLPYPFRSFEGDVRFTQEQTGTRTFDYNADGVAQYGLFADLLADIQRRPGGRKALGALFGSAEAYLQTWRLAEAR